MNIPVLYKNKDLLVCVKPAGVATQTARLTQQDMVSLLRNQLAVEKEPTELHVVHRLDQPVEGLLVFARTSQAAAWLDRQVSAAAGHAMTKEYLAEVEGVLTPPSGRLEDLLIKEAGKNTSRVARQGEPGAKKASLTYETVETASDGSRSLLKIHLETGRHHQIRVQLSHAGHPIVGDARYGRRDQNTSQGVLKLCACRLQFRMPDKTIKSFEIKPTWI